MGQYSKYAQFSHNTQIDPARLAGSLAQNANYHGTAPQQMQFNATVKQIEAFAAANPNRSLSKNTLQEYMQQRNTEYLSGISHTLPQGTAAQCRIARQIVQEYGLQEKLENPKVKKFNLPQKLEYINQAGYARAVLTRKN